MRHPHATLLVAVLVAFATEPAVQAGRDAATNAEYVGAAAGLSIRAAVALGCLVAAWAGQQRLRLTPVLGLAALLGAGWLVLHLALGVEPDQDLGFYAEDGRSLLDGTYPRSEYPTAAVGLFALETWLGGSPPHVVHALVMLGFHLVTVVAIWSVGTRWSAWLATFVAIWPLNLFHWELRYDLAPTALLVVALALALRRRWSGAGVAFGVGTALKWSPAVAFVSMLAWVLARGDRSRNVLVRFAGSFACAFAVLTVPFLLWAPWDVLAAYGLQGDRGTTGESLWYLPLALLGLASAGATPSDEAGVPAAIDVAVAAIQVIVVALVVVCAARSRSRSSAVALSALAPAAILVTNRVFSSQFLVLLVAVWAFAAALVVVSAWQQLAVGFVMAAATFANALVHPYTVWVAWELASAAMFALAVGLTAWLVVRAASGDRVPP